MNLCDLAPEYIRAIHPYQPGKPISELAREMGMDEHSIIKLASNENPLGTSPLALKAMLKALDKVALYPRLGASPPALADLSPTGFR